MSRLELPHDSWAELREPDEIPRKGARQFRKVLYRLAAPARDLDPTLDAEAQAAAVGKAMLSSDDGMDGVEDLAEAMVLCVVREWSYGAVCEAVLDEVPDKAIDAIYSACQAGGYIEKLMPDFSVNPDPESFTAPSGV
jgi:hypothetical protein